MFLYSPIFNANVNVYEYDALCQGNSNSNKKDTQMFKAWHLRRNTNAKLKSKLNQLIYTHGVCWYNIMELYLYIIL